MTLTLQQALRQALEANPNTATARSQIATSQAQVRQLRTSILPHLDLESAVTRNSREVAFDVNGFRATILPLNDWSAHRSASSTTGPTRRCSRGWESGSRGDGGKKK